MARSSPARSLGGFGAPAPLQPVDWQDLISLRPPVDIQKQVRARGGLVRWNFHRIEDAVGPANLDYYPVQVTRLPQKRSLQTAEHLLTHIRLNLNDFLDSRLTRFRAWDATEEAKWSSMNPLGTILHLRFRESFKVGSVNIDGGSVVVSDYTPRYWRVHTIWNLPDLGHPVSGCREWGFKPDDAGGYVFYTRAADRLTKSYLLAAKNQVYASQHALWLSFQSAIETFVRKEGGQATVLSPTVAHHDWALLASQHHRPTVPWI
jgi:hypothetical protein